MAPRKKTDKQQLVSRRTARRYRMSGIVALANCGEPAVMIIHDLSRKGVSFLHSVCRFAAEDEIIMDILVYDFKSCSEQLIDRVDGRVQSTTLVTDPTSKGLIWRTRVAFQKLSLA